MKEFCACPKNYISIFGIPHIITAGRTTGFNKSYCKGFILAVFWKIIMLTTPMMNCILNWRGKRRLDDSGKGVSGMPMIFDVALSQLVRERLQHDARTAGVTVDVSCSNGDICLIGRVDTEEQKDTALFLVQGLTGVKSVMDQIIIRQS